MARGVWTPVEASAPLAAKMQARPPLAYVKSTLVTGLAELTPMLLIQRRPAVRAPPLLTTFRRPVGTRPAAAYAGLFVGALGPTFANQSPEDTLPDSTLLSA